ncbi:VOC family protein [bacterium]|nr:VOC family protein [bacterium]
MNNICHFDLPARDSQKSAAFYEKLFGWKLQPMGPYTLVSPPEGIGGGIDPDGTTTILYIEVESIPAKLKEIEAAGGAIAVPETKIETGNDENYGKIGLFKDPEGTLMGLWSK